MDYSVFRERLRALMNSRGFTLASLSGEINITPATLSRYLGGQRTPDLPYVVKLSEYFGVSTDWLLGLNNDRYEVLPPNIREIAHLYSLATEDDRRVVQAVLNKYREEK